MSALDQFVKDTVGHEIGTNSANLGQCVGLVQDWFQREQEPFFYGDAKDLYNNAPLGYYSRGTDWPAPKGAAAVFDGTWGGGVGHVVLSLGGGQVLEQNNPTGSLTKQSNYGTNRPGGYIGWILPNNYKEDEVSVPNDGDIINAKRFSTGVANYQPTGKEFDFFKDPANGWPALFYDTLKGAKVQRDLAGGHAQEVLDQVKKVIGG